METNSQPQETPEYHTFREHYDRLVHAIQDPLPLATRLFSKGIITSAVKERMIVLGLTTLEKNNALLSAVEKQIQSNPCTLHGFLSALNEDPSLRALVESVQGTCLISEDKKYSNGRQIPYSGKLSREKTLANFMVLWLFTKVFSTNFGSMVSFGTEKASNLQKFSQ